MNDQAMTAEQALIEVRKSFELWAPTAGMLIDRDKDGKYEQAMTRHYWLVWQAAKSDTEAAAVVMADPDSLADLLAGKRDNATIYRTKKDWKAGVPLFVRQALAAPRVPEGWLVMRGKYGIIVQGPEGMITEQVRSSKQNLCFHDPVIYQFLESLLTAASVPSEPEFLEIPKSLRRLSNFEEHGQQVIDELREQVKVLEVALIEVAHSTAVSMPDELRHHIDRLISTDRLRDGGSK